MDTLSPHGSCFAQWLIQNSFIYTVYNYCLEGKKNCQYFAHRQDTAVECRTVQVSMGTVVTGNHEEYGWNGYSGSVLTGKQIPGFLWSVMCSFFDQTAMTGDALPSGND